MGALGADGVQWLVGWAAHIGAAQLEHVAGDHCAHGTTGSDGVDWLPNVTNAVAAPFGAACTLAVAQVHHVGRYKGLMPAGGDCAHWFAWGCPRVPRGVGY